MCPEMTYRHMHDLTSYHANPGCITDNILQEASDSAMLDLFGIPSENVMYAEAIQDAIRGMGHSCKLVFADRRDVICQLRITMLFKEQKRRELNNEPALERGPDSETFVEDFLIEHKVALTAQLGMEDGPPMRFLTGIFIATSTSKSQVPFLQDVVQADAAHMTLVKYTLFSAYANTANGAMAPLEFGMLFGNKDKENWKKFWCFVKSVHPIVNQPSKTVITDQDKGLLGSLWEIFPEAGLFHCSFHRRQNIMLSQTASSCT
jgi:hypothetical protein